MNPEIISQIFEFCIIPLLAILTRYAIKFIDAKAKELNAKTENQVAQKYILMIADTIKKCVKTTNQTYVDSLKQQGKFDDAAQEEAFKRTFDAVLVMLGEDAKNYITETTGDLNTYLKQSIESLVNDNKTEKK